MQLTSKAQSMGLYRQGLFGNHPRCWFNVDDLIALGEFPWSVVFRYARYGCEAYRRYNLTWDQIPLAVAEIVAAGGSQQHITVNELMPDDRLTFQGEVTIDHGSWYLFGSDEKTQMVPALRSGREYHGVHALTILKTVMDQPSFDQLNHLIETFPDHIIEFSSYACAVGELGFNTVFWDVRAF